MPLEVAGSVAGSISEAQWKPAQLKVLLSMSIRINELRQLWAQR